VRPQSAVFRRGCKGAVLGLFTPRARKNSQGVNAATRSCLPMSPRIFGAQFKIQNVCSRRLRESPRGFRSLKAPGFVPQARGEPCLTLKRKLSGPAVVESAVQIEQDPGNRLWWSRGMPRQTTRILPEFVPGNQLKLFLFRWNFLAKCWA